MNRRMIPAAAVLVLLVAGCGAAATPAPSLAPGVTQAPGATQGPAGTDGAPGSNVDSTLAGRFPKEVDGMPVTGVTTVKYDAFLRALGASQAQMDDFKLKFSNAGADISAVSYGYAAATVDGDSVQIQALRFPGKSADQILKNIDVISPLEPGDKRKEETFGGKKVSVVRDDQGEATDFFYANGDTIWTLNGSTEDEATAVFKALQ